MSRNPYIQAAEELRVTRASGEIYESDGNCVVQAMAQRRQYQPALALKSKLTGVVELLLFVWVAHFCVQINLGDFQRLVAEPTSDFHQVEASYGASSSPPSCEDGAGNARSRLGAFRRSPRIHVDCRIGLLESSSYTARNSARRAAQSILICGGSAPQGFRLHW